MGIMGYSGMSPFRVGSSTIRITLKNLDGSSAGTIGISKPTRGRLAKNKKPKKVQYKFKQVSTQIMRTKKSAAAGQVISTARQMVASLKRMYGTGDYDDTELRHAIEHAERMVRIAKKKKKHLLEEENAGKKGGVCQGDLEQQDEEALMEECLSEDAAEMAEEEMRELLQELQQQMQELMEEMQSESVPEEELTVSHINMDPEELEELKKKHRAEEWKEILEADMKYLKAMFDKYQQDRKNAGSSGSSGSSRSSGDSAGSSGAVSLEIGGTEVPVTTSGDVPVVTEGAGMDTLV